MLSVLLVLGLIDLLNCVHEDVFAQWCLIGGKLRLGRLYRIQKFSFILPHTLRHVRDCSLLLDGQFVSRVGGGYRLQGLLRLVDTR